jgi:hypothetical protein
METFHTIWRKIKRFFLYLYALIFSVVVRRRIDINEIQISGQGNFWQVSYRTKVSLPSKRIHLEFLRAAPQNTKFYRVALAIKIAEDVCKEQFLPSTPVFINVDKDKIVVIIKEN